MAAASMSTFSGAFKTRYPAMKLKYMGYMNNVLFALMPKDETFTGDQMKVPLHYGGNQGGSHVFATAQANKSGGRYAAFFLTRVKDYALGSIETEVIDASATDVGAFLKAVQPETDNTIRNAAHGINISLYRNSGGARGQVGSVGGSGNTVLTLKKISDVVHFEVDMYITSSSTDGTSGSDDGEAIKITAIDRDAGTLTAAGSWIGGGNFSANDYLFREDDFGTSLSGLDSWVPATAPSATTFFGVDRSVDVTRLGGLRYDGSAQSFEDALIIGASRVHREGGALSHFLMNTADLRKLRQSLGSRVVYDQVRPTDMPQIGFRSVVVSTEDGDVQVVGDRDCPEGVCYGLQMDTWKFYSLGPAPKFLKAMSQGSDIWDYNADSVEFRTGWYGQVGCSAPGKNIRITLPTG